MKVRGCKKMCVLGRDGSYVSWVCEESGYVGSGIRKGSIGNMGYIEISSVSQ